MVESAPLFIEYLAEGYMNYAAVEFFSSVLGLLTVGLVLGAFYLGWRCGKHSIFHCNAADILPFLD